MLLLESSMLGRGLEGGREGGRDGERSSQSLPLCFPLQPAKMHQERAGGREGRRTSVKRKKEPSLGE